MAHATFRTALAAVLVHEGGYVDHPKDPGGPTNQGVTQRVYDAWRMQRGLERRSVKDMTSAEVGMIYQVQYWDVIQGAKLPAGVDYVVFDGAVNSGPVQSAKWLQRALGVPADGHIGERTLRAVRECRNHDDLVAAICAMRLAFLQALRTWATFGKGWTSRVNDVRQRGQAMAGGGEVMMPVTRAGSQRATKSDAVQPRSFASADALAGAGLPTAGAGAAINEARTALEPLAGSSGTINAIIAALVVAGVVLTIGGMAYRFWAARKNAELAEALA